MVFESAIYFKSTPENWKKEIEGLKRNTVRFTDDWNEFRWDRFNNATHVIIERTTDNKRFGRKITDRTLYKNIAIISW